MCECVIFVCVCVCVCLSVLCFLAELSVANLVEKKTKFSNMLFFCCFFFFCFLVFANTDGILNIENIKYTKSY